MPFKKLVYLLSLSIILTPVLVQAASITPTVTTDAFDGPDCTLRNAIEALNRGQDFGGCSASDYGNNDTVALEAQTYTLSLGGADEDCNENGDLDIRRPMIIQGTGMETSIISGSGFPTDEEDRVLHMLDPGCGEGGSGQVSSQGFGGMVTINDLTIRDGNALSYGYNGGGIHNSDVEVVTISRVRVTENQAQDGGGIIQDSDFSSSVMMIFNSEITQNFADGESGGIDADEAITWIDSTTIDSNRANREGGGVSNDAVTFITNSTISRNTALCDGLIGGTGGTQPKCTGFGGGIHFEPDGLVVINSTISGNSARLAGGGIYAELTDADGAGNEPGEVHGVHLYNVTITDNSVVGVNGDGGGIYSDSENESGGDIFTTGLIGTGFSLANTIVQGNSADFGPDCFGSYISDGFNLIGSTSDCSGFGPGTNDQIDLPSAGLGPLANNGGPTETHGLMEGSPAIDMGNNQANLGCVAPNVETQIETGEDFFEELTRDQRGFTRPINICDVGAFEFQTFDVTLSKDDGLNGQPVAVGSQVTYTILITNNGPGDIVDGVLTDALPAGVSFVSVDTDAGNCTPTGNVIECLFDTIAVGQSVTVTIVVTVNEVGSLTNVALFESLLSNVQAQISLEDQVTTQVTTTGAGLVVFGSGFCGLNPQGPMPGAAAGLLVVLALGFWTMARARKRAS